MTEQAFNIMAAIMKDNTLDASKLMLMGLGESEAEIDFIIEQLKKVKRV
jgi:hypothetical protein